MLYMVECAFADPTREQAWNDYYSGRKLDEVLAVPGFRTSQRFKIITDSPVPYFAIHSVDSLEVLMGSVYRGCGGGAFDQNFEPYVTNWRRSFYSGLERAPAIAENEFLAVTDQTPDEVKNAGIEFTWLKSAGLDAATPQRGIARLNRTQVEQIGKNYHHVINVYAPMMSQRREPPGKQPR